MRSPRRTPASARRRVQPKGPFARSGDRNCCVLIAIDGKFTASRAAGVERYAREITRTLMARKPDRYVFMAPPWARFGPQAHGIRRRVIRWSNNAWEQLWLPRSSRRADLLYCPGSMAPARDRRTVVVIHDAIPLLHPEWYSKAFARWTQSMFPAIAERARHVITDSLHSQRVLEQVLPGVRQKVSTIYPGIGDQFRPQPQTLIDAVRARHGLAQPYLLCLSSLDPRKNFARIVDAWERAGLHREGWILAVCGMSSELFRKSWDLARRVGSVSGVRLLDFVPDDDIPPLIAGARALIHPSLDEGFGFPPLEAMACGTPALVSRCGSLPEVCEDAALYADAEDTASIADAMRALTMDDELRASLVRKGAQLVRRYTWDATAQHTESVFQRCLGG